MGNSTTAVPLDARISVGRAMAQGSGKAHGRVTATMITTAMLLADIDGEDVEHLTGSIENKVALLQRVIFDRVPRKFGEERNHGFIASLRGALGVIGL